MALEIWIAEMNKELKVKGFVAFAKTLALAPYSLVSLERWCSGGDYIGLSFGLVLNWNSTHLFIFSTLRQPAHCAAGKSRTGLTLTTTTPLKWRVPLQTTASILTWLTQKE